MSEYFATNNFGYLSKCCKTCYENGITVVSSMAKFAQINHLLDAAILQDHLGGAWINRQPCKGHRCLLVDSFHGGQFGWCQPGQTHYWQIIGLLLTITGTI